MRRKVLAAIAIASMLAGCGGDDGDEKADGGTATTTTAPTTTTALEPVTGVDFRAGGMADLGDGWTLSPCEAGPPLFCFRLDGVTQGVTDPVTFPAERNEVVGPVVQRGGSDEEALKALAASVQESAAEDRRRGCGDDYDVEGFGPEEVRVAGHPGVVYGFDGRKDGEHVERQVQFATIVDGTVYIIPIEAIDEDSCVHDPELDALEIEQLEEIQRRLEPVIAHSRLPEPRPVN